MNQDRSTTNILDREDGGDDTLRGMFRSFHSRRMYPANILVWIVTLVFMAGAVYSVIRFFDAIDTKSQIMFATIFLTCIQLIAIMKIFSWLMIHRDSIKHAIRRLETRLDKQSP